MPQIKAMGIDPGGTTGVAVAEVRIEITTLTLSKLFLQSIVSAEDVADVVIEFRPRIIYMEKRAPIPTSEDGLVPFESILRDLQGFDYAIGVLNFESGIRGVKLITPGLWKPFVQARSIETGTWYPETDHEKDAMGLLYYGLQTNSPKKKVRYE